EAERASEGLPPRRSALSSQSAGYIQAIDMPGLVSLLQDRDGQLLLHRRPGDFTHAGEIIGELASLHNIDEEFLEQVDGHILRGDVRMPRQDVECAVNELVEVAVRALSPGINDPFTAYACIDRLRNSLCRLVRRAMPNPVHSDDKGMVRVVAEPHRFDRILYAAFNQIRQYGADSPGVAIRLLESLDALARTSEQPAVRDAVAAQAAMVLETAEKHDLCANDMKDVRTRFEQVQCAVADFPT
ncbi:MAG: DUF2254 domain-containing protein, partial [Planctomycetales bacterium]|nr:DUF2254 domain-containing protein [Planctomycetales bacterium]